MLVSSNAVHFISFYFSFDIFISIISSHTASHGFAAPIASLFPNRLTPACHLLSLLLSAAVPGCLLSLLLSQLLGMSGVFVYLLLYGKE